MYHLQLNTIEVLVTVVYCLSLTHDARLTKRRGGGGCKGWRCERENGNDEEGEEKKEDEEKVSRRYQVIWWESEKMLFHCNFYFGRWLISCWQLWQAFNLILTHSHKSSGRLQSTLIQRNPWDTRWWYSKSESNKKGREREAISVIKELYFCRGKNVKTTCSFWIKNCHTSAERKELKAWDGYYDDTHPFLGEWGKAFDFTTCCVFSFSLLSILESIFQLQTRLSQEQPVSKVTSLPPARMKYVQ